MLLISSSQEEDRMKEKENEVDECTTVVSVAGRRGASNTGANLCTSSRLNAPGQTKLRKTEQS